MASLNILVIDDEPALRQIMAAVLGRAGYNVDQAAGVAEATSRLARGDIDLALCDIRMPDGTGLDLLRQSKAVGLDTTFVMVTASASMETAVEALRGGAFDYIVKPVRNEELLNRVAQIEAMRGLSDENRQLRAAVRSQSPPAFQFRSPSMQQVDHLANKVAPTDSTVLILGESGCGKGLLARQIHERSPRAARSFVSVNCSAIPEQLLESEFFGHIRGAFTGADRARKGLFLEADHGTLFLDEVGELPLPMQTKLLHAIEDKQVRPVGSEQSRRVDVRILVATNRDLLAMTRQGTFREDLYFRLSMFQIPLPPLRERQPDIRPFIQFLLRNGHDGISRPIALDPEAESMLLGYAWPGNVRELDNVINRARILAENDRITVADLPAAVIAASIGTEPRLAGPFDGHGSGRGNGHANGHDHGLRERLRRVEVEIIGEAIATADGDRRVAAQQLGISLSSLYRKLGEAGANE